MGQVICFGELLLRLATPGGIPLVDSTHFTAHAGGAEGNVAAALAQLGHRAQIVTALPDGPLGDLPLGRFRQLGVGTDFVIRAPGRLGLYFLEAGAGLRASRIVYDREGSVFAARAGDFDWPSILRGASWLHLSGITLALSDVAAEAALAAASAANSAGIPVSFDANYRASLWTSREDAAAKLFGDVMRLADLLFAGPADIARVASTADASAFDLFPKLWMVASTRRELAADGSQTLSATVQTRGQAAQAGPVHLAGIVERIGSGDAFAAGVIHGRLRGATPEQCAADGLAACALKHSIAGDQWIGTAADLAAFDATGPADVQR